MHRIAQRLASSPNLQGYAVHWCHPADETRTISFHPEILSYSMAAEMRDTLSRCGLSAYIQPLILKNYISKIPGNQQASPTPVELKIAELSDIGDQ